MFRIYTFVPTNLKEAGLHQINLMGLTQLDCSKRTYNIVMLIIDMSRLTVLAFKLSTFVQKTVPQNDSTRFSLMIMHIRMKFQTAKRLLLFAN